MEEVMTCRAQRVRETEGKHLEALWKSKTCLCRYCLLLFKQLLQKILRKNCRNTQGGNQEVREEQ